MAGITKDTTLGEAVSNHPAIAPILMKYGLHCIGCHVAFSESIEGGALSHGLDNKTIKKMVDEINATIAKQKK